MNNDKQLEQLSNLANDVENLLDKIEKKTGFQNILKKIHSFIPETIDTNLSNIDLNDDYKLNDYRISRYYDFWKIIRFVKDNIDAISEYEKDSEDQKEERKIKSLELHQFIFPKYKVVKRTQHYGVKTWLEEETEEDPNWIYSYHGTYTKYLSKKSHWYYPICLNLALSISNLDFEIHNAYVLLYIAVNNELKSLIAILDILGIDKGENQIYMTTTPEPGHSTNNNTINVNHNSMNYKLILLNALNEHREQKTTYKSYFKREAKIANRNNFVEFLDYFDGCQYVLETYKNEILRQYKIRLTENDWVVTSIKSGRGIKFEDELVTDESDKRIQDHLKYIAEDKEFVQNRGYQNNYDYVCYLKKTGEITNDIMEQSNERKLFWQDIVHIERGVYQAKEDLLVQNSNNTTTVTLLLNPTQINILLENYNFWKGQEKHKSLLNKNIFENYTFDQFITMIQKNDFTSVFIRGYKDRVKYNIYILSRFLGVDWGQITAKKLNCEFKDLTKNTKFIEHPDLKDMYLQSLP